VADLSNLLRVLGGLRHLLHSSTMLADDDSHSLVDAALERHRIVPGADHAAALGEDSAASTVAVVVPSPATSEVLEATSLTIWRAHVLELVLRAGPLGHGHAVLGNGRSAQDFSMTTLRPSGRASRSRIGEHLHAAQDLVAAVRAELYDFGSHTNLSSSLVSDLDRLLNNSEDVVLSEEIITMTVRRHRTSVESSTCGNVLANARSAHAQLPYARTCRREQILLSERTTSSSC